MSTDAWSIRTAGFEEQINKLENYERIAAGEFNRAMGHAVDITQSQVVKNFNKHYDSRTGALVNSVFGRALPASTFSKIKGEVGVGLSLSTIYPFVLEVGRKPGRSGAIQGQFYTYYAPRDKRKELDALFETAMEHTVDKLQVKASE